MHISKLLLLAFMLPACSENIVHKSDTFACPTLNNPNGQLVLATRIGLFSRHPSELAQLKPDNADTDETGPLFWTMGASNDDYWYQCDYEMGKREFKLPKVYFRCANIGSDKFLHTLKCE